ncbi:MAG: glycosyltransferase [Eubacteriales bacterium]|nr:glycosyltransferase [Eubacteriales bacterium]
MENEQPLVSIVCDTFHHAPYIRDALEGFLAQETSFSTEIIMHDDASTDGTADIIREFERAHPGRFRCVYREQNIYSQDPKILEHYVFPLARGKYVAICEGDDYWTNPRKLQMQIDYMESHPDCAFCVSSAEMVTPEKGHLGWVRPYESDCDIPMDELIRGGGGFVPTASIVTRTQLAQNRAPFCDMADVDDAVLQLWFGANGTTHYFAEPTCAYRYEVPGSWTKTFFASDRASRIRHHEGMIRALKAFNEQFGGKWQDAVDFCIIHQQQFEILRLKNDVKTLEQPPFREQYLQLPRHRRLRMRLARLGILRN